jgi:hypothetical protein
MCFKSGEKVHIRDDTDGNDQKIRKKISSLSPLNRAEDIPNI